MLLVQASRTGKAHRYQQMLGGGTVEMVMEKTSAPSPSYWLTVLTRISVYSRSSRASFPIREAVGAYGDHIVLVNARLSMCRVQARDNVAMQLPNVQFFQGISGWAKDPSVTRYGMRAVDRTFNDSLNNWDGP